MKNIFKKILFVALVAVLGGALTGCNRKEEMKQFSVSFKGFGPGYVSLYATVPTPTTVAYTISEEPIVDLPGMPWNATTLNLTGQKTTFYSDGEQQLLDFPIEENKK